MVPEPSLSRVFATGGVCAARCAYDCVDLALAIHNAYGSASGASSTQSSALGGRAELGASFVDLLSVGSFARAQRLRVLPTLEVVQQGRARAAIEQLQAISSFCC